MCACVVGSGHPRHAQKGRRDGMESPASGRPAASRCGDVQGACRVPTAEGLISARNEGVNVVGALTNGPSRDCWCIDFENVSGGGRGHDTCCVLGRVDCEDRGPCTAIIGSSKDGATSPHSGARLACGEQPRRGAAWIEAHVGESAGDAWIWQQTVGWSVGCRPVALCAHGCAAARCIPLDR
jgi:hypothetical protein